MKRMRHGSLQPLRISRSTATIDFETAQSFTPPAFPFGGEALHAWTQSRHAAASRTGTGGRGGGGRGGSGGAWRRRRATAAAGDGVGARGAAATALGSARPESAPARWQHRHRAGRRAAGIGGGAGSNAVPTKCEYGVRARTRVGPQYRSRLLGTFTISPRHYFTSGRVPPPKELADKHFNDWVLAFRRNQRNDAH